MDGRKIVLIVGALIVAAITAFMARTLMVGSGAPTAGASAEASAPAPTVEVMVATRALPVGTIIDPSAVKYVAWPRDLVEGAYFIKGQSDPTALQGTVVRLAIAAGQPVTQGSLVEPGERGFLAAALGPGMRAVTVPVSAQNSVAGFIFPGDRVDLILTQTVQGDGQPLRAAETVVRNLRVLATDQRTHNQTDDHGQPVPATYSTVTLEATPRIAEMISVAQAVGQISLSLRPLADTSSELEESIARGDVSVPAGTSREAEEQMIERARNEPSGGRGSFVTGADVSRFQRSSAPSSQSSASTAPQPFPAAPGAGNRPAPTGPVVRVARGNTVTVVPVGTNNSSRGE